MSAELNTARRIASKGLKAIEKVLIELDGLPRDEWSRTHVKDITDCVNAAVKVLAEERERDSFEREAEAAARKVNVPEGVKIDGRPMIDVMTDIYRFRLVAGDVTTTELGRMTDQFLSIDHAKVALILKLLGPNVAGKTSEEIEALKEGRILARQEPTQPANVAPAKAGEAEDTIFAPESLSAVAASPPQTPAAIQGDSGATVHKTSAPAGSGKTEDNASPKGCDMASHAPSGENGSESGWGGGFHAADDDEDDE